MKTIPRFMGKSIFLSLSLLLLLTACQGVDVPLAPESAIASENISAETSYEITPGNVFSDSPSETPAGNPSSGTSSGTTPGIDFPLSPSEIPAGSASSGMSSGTTPGIDFPLSPSEIPAGNPSSGTSSGTASGIAPEGNGPDAPFSELQVHFIDVGQGDSTLVTCGGDTLLIDAGDNNKGTTVQLYLQKQGVESLTYVIGTHPDSDHIGGLDVIMTKFDCGTVIMPDVTADTATYRDVIDAMAYKNYQNTLPRVGDIYPLGDAEFTVIAPNRAYDDDNNSSVGIRLVHGDNVFLFTGDAEKEAEADILQNGIDLRADVLHAGHHGSSSSCSEDFISQVSPMYVVVSCGTDNPYDHPHQETLDALQEQDAQIFRTDRQGSIVAVSDGVSIAWNTEPEPPEAGIGNIPADTVTYVLNTNTNRFHEPNCSSVTTIKDSNRKDTYMTREEVLEAGFVPCKKCNP